MSHVLNGSGAGVRIPEPTRQRVLEVMQQLGYVPNVVAQRLAGGRNRILGVFTYEQVFPTSNRDFFSPFLEGIEEAAAELDYDLLLHTRPAARSGGTRPLYRGGESRLHLADGTVMLGLLDDVRRRELAKLIHRGHAVVFIGRREVPDVTLTYVTANYAQATRQALYALLERGHRSTLYLGVSPSNESAKDRETGYLNALQHTSTAGAVIRLQNVSEELVKGALRSGVTGLLFENERLTSQWTAAAAQLGFEWPRDYGFAVLGDPLYHTEMPLEWAHFRVPRLEMGRQAIALLQALLEGEQPVVLNLDCSWHPSKSLGGMGPGS